MGKGLYKKSYCLCSLKHIILERSPRTSNTSGQKKKVVSKHLVHKKQTISWANKGRGIHVINVPMTARKYSFLHTQYRWYTTECTHDIYFRYVITGLIQRSFVFIFVGSRPWAVPMLTGQYCFYDSRTVACAQVKTPTAAVR